MVFWTMGEAEAKLMILVLSQHFLHLFKLVVNLEGLVGHLKRFCSGLDTSLLQELTLLIHPEGSWFRAQP